MANKISPNLCIFLLVLSAAAGFVLSLYTHRPKAIANSRTYHSPVVIVDELKDSEEGGKKIFMHFCASCHAENPAIRVRAPSITNRVFWDRVKQQGKTRLLNATLHGIGAMPARGGCFECSDAQLEQTIDYMLNYQNK